MCSSDLGDNLWSAGDNLGHAHAVSAAPGRSPAERAQEGQGRSLHTKQNRSGPRGACASRWNKTAPGAGAGRATSGAEGLRTKPLGVRLRRAKRGISKVSRERK